MNCKYRDLNSSSYISWCDFVKFLSASLFNRTYSLSTFTPTHFTKLSPYRIIVLLSLQIQNFNSEFVADYATIYVGSLDPTRATRVARLSGNLGNQIYRSYNNLMIIVFSTDSAVTNTAFTGSWNSCKFTGFISLRKELDRKNVS